MTDALASTYPQHLATVKQRSDEALETAGFEHLAIYSGRAHVQFLDDRADPFKTNPHLKAWAPLLNQQDSWIVYTPGERPMLVYYRPTDYWFLPPKKPAGYWAEHFDIRYITAPAEVSEHLPDLAQITVVGALPDDLLGLGVTSVNDQRVLDHLHYYRPTKTAYEIECMRRATELGVRAHRAAEHAFRDGASEYEIHQAYCMACEHREEDLPYNNIVGMNAHGAALHYQMLDRVAPAPDQRYSLLIDAGAEFNGYACDITRTYAYREDAFSDLIAAMDQMQLRLCDALRPGIDYRDLHLQAHASIAEILTEFGFVKLSADEIVATGISSTFFPHGLGHYLGLQVHEVGGFAAGPDGSTIPRPEGHPFLRLTRKLEIDQILTIEPGLYFIEPLLEELQASETSRHVDWERVDAFRRFGGVRIEDNVRITESGHDNLTRREYERQIS